MRSDVELLDAWRGGDAAAGNTLCKRYVDPLYRFFRNKAPQGAEDLVQRTLTAAVEGRERFAGRSSFRGYLYGIAHNMLKADIRQRMRLDHDPDFSTQSLQDLAPSPSSALGRAREQQLLSAAMRRIPVDYQVALELYYWENFTGPELAQMLGIGEPGVRSRLRRAKAALRDAMLSIGASPTDADESLSQMPARDEPAN
ncbi:MAG: sigma-70 family RNA polymerase sigma factor [Myxococcota bacterium]